jgi:hypothetical protein
MPDKSVKVGNVLLNEVDQLALLNRYKSLYGEPKDDNETDQRMNELVSSLASYKSNKLNTESDDAIANYFTKPWKSDINQAQNALQYKSGIPISSLDDKREVPKQPKQIKSVVAKSEQNQSPTFWQRLTDENAYTPEEQDKIAKRQEQSAMGIYATTYLSHLTKSIWNGLGTIATGKIMDLFPGSSDIARNFQAPIREELYKKYFLEPGKQLNYEPNDENKAKTNETVRNIFGLAGDVSSFMIPVAGEERLAAGAAELIPKATTWLARFGAKTATAGASQLPKVVPIVYGQSLDKGSEMGLTGDDLDNYARLNTALTWGAYSLIPNVFTKAPGLNDKIAKTILNPNSKTGARLLADVATRAVGSGVAGTAAAAGDIAATNIYGPEEAQVSMNNPKTWKGLGEAFLTNAIIHTGFEAKNIGNLFKTSNTRYSNMVSDMALEKDKTTQLINNSVEKGYTSREDADKAIGLLNKIEPYAKNARSMPGIKPSKRGVAAFELARLEDLVNERNKQTNPDAINDFNNKIDKSLENLNSLQNGTNFKGTLAKPEEIIDMVAKHTPEGRLNDTQVFRMANEYGFKQNEVDPNNFKDDPTVQEYIAQFRDGTLVPEENTSGMPIVLDGNGGIIDGKKRIAKRLFDAEQTQTQPQKLEVLRPISESELADGISDLNAVNPMKQAEYARAKEVEFLPSMAQETLKTTGEVSGVEAPESGRKLNIGEAVSKVYHTAKEKSLESKAPITEQDVLDNTLTGEIDGESATEAVKNFLSEYDAAPEDKRSGLLKAFVDKVNKSKDAIRNPNVTAFRAAIEFALKAGIPKENLAKTLEGALGVKQQYIDGYMKVLDQKGLIPEVSKRSMFKAPEANQPNVEMPKKGAPKKEAAIAPEVAPEVMPEEIKVEEVVTPEEVKVEEVITEVPKQEPTRTRKEEVEYQIEQLEKAKEEKVKSLMDNGASKAEAEKIAEAEMPKDDKKALRILKKELKTFEEKPVPLPSESDSVTTEQAPGEFDDVIAFEAEEPTVEAPVAEDVLSDREFVNRKNEIIKSTNKKNLKDIFDILEKEGILERDPNNTKDCI